MQLSIFALKNTRFFISPAKINDVAFWQVDEDSNSNHEMREITIAEVRRILRPRSRIRGSWPPLRPQEGKHCQIVFRPASGKNDREQRVVVDICPNK